MKFRTTLLIAVLSLVVGPLLATVLAVSIVIDRAARRDVSDGLSRSQDVFVEQLKQREALLRTESRVVAEEPRLKAVAATEDVTHETVLGVAQELKRALQSDTFLMTDENGVLLADTSDAAASGFDMSKLPMIATALSNGEASLIVTDQLAGKESLIQMQTRRLAFGTTVVGVVGIGYRFNDKAAEAASRQCSSGVAMQVDGKTVALSGAPGSPADVDAALASVTPGAPTEVTLGGQRFLAVVAPMPGYVGAHRVQYALMRSLEDALAPKDQLLHLLYVVFGVALLAAFVLSFTFSGRIAKPIFDLATFARSVAKGELRPTAKVAGSLEVRALAQAMNEMVSEIATSRRKLAERERAAKEMEIATRIQTSILPKNLSVERLQIAASMAPASDVGGDYYDVLPFKNGAFIGIGDVAGHGLSAGLLMLMIQSLVSALVRSMPDSAPSGIVNTLNSLMFENIRARLSQDEHVTFTLLKYSADGRVVFAGAHEEMLLCHKEGPCEQVPTPGTWLGAMESIVAHTVDTELMLRSGDVLVVYSDGLIEGHNAAGEEMGLARIAAIVEKHRDEPVDEIRKHALAAVAAHMGAKAHDDDVTLVVMRYT